MATIAAVGIGSRTGSLTGPATYQGPATPTHSTAVVVTSAEPTTTAAEPATVPTEGLIWPPRTGAVTVEGGGGGGTPTRYTHTQAVLASTWSITHNLGAHPAVSVEDAVGTVLHGTIQYLSDDALTITFARSVTGRANLV